MHNFLLATGFGIVTASIIALATVALSLQYSVTNVPNFAHGEIMTIGAYGALEVSRHANNVPLEVIVAVGLGATFAWGMNKLLLQPFLHKGAKNLVLFVVTIAVSLILQNIVLLIFGGANQALTVGSGALHHVGPFQFSTMAEYTIVAAAIVLLLVHVILKYTAFGKAQRAVSDNRELARVSGVNADRIVGLTWLLSGAITGLAGFVLAATIGSIAPSTGNSYLLVIFAAGVVGGIGQAYGAIIGALVIGMTMELSALYLPSDYKTLIAFALLVVTLVVRPGGIITTRLRNATD
ncbi:MAG: branched-chain amino acid transport system permease protein [Mycobacterium sp.]|jgi:neutral amino acid transport system permease protein|uniref:branched-chain amino acid ABC transporter permease n=1 Tax=Mycobacterium sp. TaxID=1785 RepID=UPI0028BAF0D8|nr:branched-chain amino acid ABC transporter permease [Mycobacterium sp.]MDT5120394.1 branched-chain amino acid transport system permease protein [Mycobacterium sp.]